MNEDAARFEFRVFAPQLGTTEQLIRDMAPCESSSESSEIYLLDCRAVPANNVKIRHGRLELKRLIEQRQGLQRWQPAGAWTFPVSLENARALWADDILMSTASQSSMLSLNDLLALAEGSAKLRRADISKQRYRFKLKGCAVELVHLLVSGKALESCAVEAPDPCAVLDVVELLQLAGESNRSYGQMLCELSHDTM